MGVPLPVLDRLILGAQRPSRYAGGELNAVHKDLAKARVTWALAFPASYVAGQSIDRILLVFHARRARTAEACDSIFYVCYDAAVARRSARVPRLSVTLT